MYEEVKDVITQAEDSGRSLLKDIVGCSHTYRIADDVDPVVVCDVLGILRESLAKDEQEESVSDTDEVSTPTMIVRPMLGELREPVIRLADAPIVSAEHLDRDYYL